MTLKLNLGCGHDIKKGYSNVDAAGGEGTITQDLITYMISLEKETVDHIVMKDVLEHLPHGLIDKDEEILKNPEELRSPESALKHCYRVLKKNGSIYIRVPDAEWIVSKWTSGDMDWDRFVWTMLGSIDNVKYDTHKAMWTIPRMEQMLQDIGFVDISIKQDHPNMVVEARR